MPYGTNLINDDGLVAYSRIISTILTRVGVLAKIPSREHYAKLGHTITHGSEVSRMLSSFGFHLPLAKKL
jgi:hypothetical protein